MGFLLETIKAGTRNYVERALPGTDVNIRIRVLTNQDILEASMAADDVWRISGNGVSMQNIKVYEAEKDIQHLYRACTDLDGKPLAPNITQFRRLLTVLDKEWLIEQYNALDAECNPSVDTMTDDDFDALVEAVKKNPDTALKPLNISTLRRLALFLASAPVNSQTGNGST
jgi:hypothetical protein